MAEITLRSAKQVIFGSGVRAQVGTHAALLGPRAIACGYALLCVLWAGAEELMTFEEIGVPIRETAALGWCVGPDAAGRVNCVYVSHDQSDGELFLVRVNVETGEATQFASPVFEEGAWACCLGSDGRVYLGTIGSHGPSHVLRFDPATDEFVDLGCPAESERYIWTFSPTSDGKIYGGTHAGARLIEIDVATGGLRDLGRLCDTEEYSRFTWYGEADRTVYALVMMVDRHIAAWSRDTETSQRVEFPGREGDGHPTVYEGADGWVYAIDEGRVWRLNDGVAESVEGDAPLGRNPYAPDLKRTFMSGSTQPPVLADGSVVTGAQAGSITITAPDGEQRTVAYDYDCVGAGLFVMREGPSGKLYGGSMGPLRVFEYDPATGQITSLGQPTQATGEVYAFTHLDGVLYMAAYGSVCMTVYDPREPWSFGTEPGCNPRDLGPLGEDQNRPHSMEVGPDGNVWIASRPSYGNWGGALTRLVPGTFEKTIWRDIVPEHSVISLAMDYERGLIWAGTDIGGGRGTRPRPNATEAVLFAFDPATERKVFECVPLPGEYGIMALAMGSDGLIYGAAHETPDIFVFDPASRDVVGRLQAPGRVLMEALQLGEDGRLYGMAREGFFRIPPGGEAVEVLGSYPGAMRGFALIGRDIYFGKGPTLCVGHLR